MKCTKVWIKSLYLFGEQVLIVYVEETHKLN